MKTFAQFFNTQLLHEGYSMVKANLINKGIDPHDVIEYCNLHKKFKDIIKTTADKPQFIDNIDVYFSNKTNTTIDILNTNFNIFKKFLITLNEQLPLNDYKWKKSDLYTYNYHIITSYSDANNFVENYFKTIDYPMTWCILGNDIPSKEIYDDYIERGWKFIYFFRIHPIGNCKNTGYSTNKELPENFDFIIIRKNNNIIKHTLTPNCYPDKTGIPIYLNNYIDIIQNL